MDLDCAFARHNIQAMLSVNIVCVKGKRNIGDVSADEVDGRSNGTRVLAR